MYFLVRCIKWISPTEEWGRSGDLCRSLIGRTNWPAVLVYVLSFPLFSLSTCVPGPACYGCVICCHFIWYLPSPAVDRWDPKLLLTWGSTMVSLCLFCPPSFTPSFPLPLNFSCNLPGVQDEFRETKPKMEEDALLLVPYEGDSSDEEEERTLSSKTDSRSWLTHLHQPGLHHLLTLDS